jgi:predicted cation transporter
MICLFVIAFKARPMGHLGGGLWKELTADRKTLLWILGGSVLWALPSVLFYWGFLLVNWALMNSMSQFNVRTFHIVVAGCVLFIGLIAYGFKRLNRKWYGIFEIGFAWFSGVSVATRLDPHHLDLSSITALAATIYIVSRGLDNIAAVESELKMKYAIQSLRDELRDCVGV